MLQYLVIILDKTSTSYCHYTNTVTERQLISLNDLKRGLFFAMKENLMVQFVLPDYDLPQDYLQVIDSIDHHIIATSPLHTQGFKADIIVLNEWKDIRNNRFADDVAYVLRITKKELFDNATMISQCFENLARLNIIITDIDTFTKEDFERYSHVLDIFIQSVIKVYQEGRNIQLNLLTDRIFLKKMNNCNAGNENITLAPNGKFYICPAFYYDDIGNCDNYIGLSDVGNLTDGLNIIYPQLYKMSHAPICRICDAFQCKRCIWLNRKLTNEVNIPSHEQCVMAHIEREASRKLLNQLHNIGLSLSTLDIGKLDYTDPFDKLISNKLNI